MIKYDEYIEKANISIKKNKLSNSNNTEIHESEIFINILDNFIQNKPDNKIINVLKDDFVKQRIFDKSYNEILSKLE